MSTQGDLKSDVSIRTLARGRYVRASFMLWIAVDEEETDILKARDEGTSERL